jgi:hypothetical protein
MLFYALRPPFICQIKVVLTLHRSLQNISPNRNPSNTVIFFLSAFVVLAVVFCSAILGILLRRILPANHLTDETRGVVILATGVVGTLTALVLGLLIAAASNSFNTKNEEIISMAADVIQIDHLLRRYGPEAENLRVLLRRHTEMKTQDLFPEGATRKST